jgi:tetratricopeptide (TPR) repeat protein
MKIACCLCCLLFIQNLFAQEDSLDYDYKYSIAYNDSILRIDSGDCFARFNRAAAFRRAGNYEQSLLDINYDIEKCKDITVFSFYNRAKAYEKLKAYDKAIKDYIKSISLQLDEKKDWSLYFQVAVCYAELKKFDDAIAWYSKAIEIAPYEGICFFNRGINLYNVKEGIKACEDLHTAQTLGIKEAAEVIEQICKLKANTTNSINTQRSAGPR